MNTTPTHKTIANTAYPNTPEGWLALHHMASSFTTEELSDICYWNDDNGEWEQDDIETPEAYRAGLVAVLKLWADADEASEADSVIVAMRVLGFAMANTGGNCTAWQGYEDSEGRRYYIIESDAPAAPLAWGARDVRICIEDDAGDMQESMGSDTLKTCLEEMHEEIHRTGYGWSATNSKHEPPAMVEGGAE